MNNYDKLQKDNEKKREKGQWGVNYAASQNGFWLSIKGGRENKCSWIGGGGARKQSKRSVQKIIFPYCSAQNQRTDQLCYIRTHMKIEKIRKIRYIGAECRLGYYRRMIYFWKDPTFHLSERKRQSNICLLNQRIKYTVVFYYTGSSVIRSVVTPLQ